MKLHILTFVLSFLTIYVLNAQNTSENILGEKKA